MTSNQLEELREQAAKIAEAWLDPNKRIIAEVNGLSERDIEVAQNVARGITAAIRAIPLPAPVALPQAGEGRYSFDIRTGDPAWIPTPTETPTAAAPDDGLMGRYRTALRLARPIVEADCATAREYADADWEGMSKTALDAIDAALSTATGDKAQQGDG